MNDYGNVLVASNERTIILRKIACLVTMDSDAWPSSSNQDYTALAIERDVDLVVEHGKVSAITGAGAAVCGSEAIEIDCSKNLVIPGLVDCHTHPVFAGSRAAETVYKAQGLSYEDIAARGGGICVTMNATRSATLADLISLYSERAHKALERGVVLLEAKTGYGLSPAEELRHLTAIYQAYHTAKIPLPRVAPTLLGPHAASPDFQGLDNYIQALVDFLPQYSDCANKLGQDRFAEPLAADIFVERNYFLPDQGERWLGAALQIGLSVKIHADEFSRSGGCELACALAGLREQSAAKRPVQGRVLSVDHCQYATESDLAALARHGVAAVALPCTSFFSGIPYIDAKKWRGAGVRAAIASDFNPGSSPINNLWMAAYLALSKCGFSLPEVYAGVTRHAAWALGADERYGTIAVGRSANLAIIRGNSPEDFFASPTGDHVETVLVSNLF